MRMLCGMVVEIDSNKRNDIGDGLDLVLWMTENVSLIEVELTQIQIEIVLSMLQSFELILLILKDRDGVIVLDALPFVDLIISIVESSDLVHAHPFVESGLGDSEFFF